MNTRILICAAALCCGSLANAADKTPSQLTTTTIIQPTDSTIVSTGSPASTRTITWSNVLNNMQTFSNWPTRATYVTGTITNDTTGNAATATLAANATTAATATLATTANNLSGSITTNQVTGLNASLNVKIDANGGSGTNVTLYGTVTSTNLSQQMTNAAAGVLAESGQITATDNGTNVVLNVGATMVVQTNIQADGLTLGGVTKTNWLSTIVPLQLLQVGAGITFGTTSNSPSFNKPILADANSATNYVDYLLYVPSDALTNGITIRILASKPSGGAGNVVLNLPYNTWSASPSLLPTPSGSASSTNDFSASAARYYRYALSPTLQVISTDNWFLIRLSRSGDDAADTSTAAITLIDVQAEFYRR